MADEKLSKTETVQIRNKGKHVVRQSVEALWIGRERKK